MHPKLCVFFVLENMDYVSRKLNEGVHTRKNKINGTNFFTKWHTPSGLVYRFCVYPYKR
jgi:hypothetical protein